MRTALVTGASSGMGKEIAKKLADDGYVVYGAARRVEKMVDLQESGVTALKMDITKDEDVVAVVDRIKADHGGVDILVNNAGFASYGAMEDTSIDDARYQFEVNLFGLARLTQLVLPYMREKGEGKIINISSMGGRMYTPLGSWYHATKHALEGWSDSLRLELEPFGISVVIVEPGAIITEFGEVAIGPMLERSGNSVYSEQAKAVAAGFRRSYEDGNGSPASVVADTISKAVASRRPKTRYVTGRYAGRALFMRRWMSDRMFDRAVRRMAS